MARKAKVQWVAQTEPVTFRNAPRVETVAITGRGRTDTPSVGTDPVWSPGSDRDVTTRVIAPLSIAAAVERRTALKIGKLERGELTRGAYCTDRVRYEQHAEPDMAPAQVWDSILGHWYPMIQLDNLKSRTHGGGVARVRATLTVKAGMLALLRALDQISQREREPVGETRSLTCWSRHLDRMRSQYARARKGLTRWTSRYAPAAPMVKADGRPLYFAAIPEGQTRVWCVGTDGRAEVGYVICPLEYRQEAARYAEACAERYARRMLAESGAERYEYRTADGTVKHVTA